MPLSRRVPKRGFHNRWALVVRSLNVGDLNDVFQDGAEVTPDSLAAAGRLKGRYDVLKFLGDGELTKKLKVSAHRFSKTALEKIRLAGGEAIILPGKAKVVKNKHKPPTAKRAATKVQT